MVNAVLIYIIIARAYFMELLIKTEHWFPVIKIGHSQL